MAVSWRNHASTQGTPGPTTTIRPAGTVNGELLVATTYTNSTVAHTLSGWTSVKDVANPARFALWYKVAASEPANYTFSAGSSIAILTITCYTGFAGTPALDVSSS